MFCLCETYGKLSLEIMTLNLHTERAETSKGVPVSVKGVAQVRTHTGFRTHTGSIQRFLALTF